MTGLIYKEFRQNRWFFLAVFLLAVFLTWMPLLTSLDGEGAAESGKPMLQYGFEQLANAPVIIFALFPVLGFLIVGMLESVIMQPDEIKKWGYFTASHPKGVAGQVYAKYVAVLAMSLLFFFVTAISQQWLAAAAFGSARVDLASSYALCILLLYIQILLRAAELPFIIRFGTKRGANIKAGIVLGLILAGLIYALFGPLPDSFDDWFEKLLDTVMGIMNGDIPDSLTLFIAILPYAAAGGFIGSYFLSKKLYMKGVEQYAK